MRRPLLFVALGALLLLGPVLLTGYDHDPLPTSDPDFASRIRRGEVVLAAQAPDGTNLWAAWPPGTTRTVFFSSAGTQTSHSESCGKNCTRTVDDVVPMAETGR